MRTYWIDADEARKPWRLVIEAKIDACESEKQLSRYDNWLDREEDKGE